MCGKSCNFAENFGYLVELNHDQWREFFWLERSYMRMEWMIHFLHYERMRHEIKELWWIPLDDQDGLQIVSTKIRKQATK